jgi:NAD(P)-dependent dehydrogenase (short-subunit alcohol dehydrogenase family)
VTVEFSAADLDLFAAASHDRNPLHLSASYARRTQFGQQVVYGILGALATMAKIPFPSGERVDSIALEFPRPAFLDTPYRIAGSALMDGSSTLAKTKVTFSPGQTDAVELTDGSIRESAAAPSDDLLRTGFERSGVYAPDPAACRALWSRLQLDSDAWGELPLASLLWSSYLAGMELPGERALYSRLTIRFDRRADRDPGPGPLEWKARIHSRNALNLIRIEFALAVRGERVAGGELGVLLRPAPIGGTEHAFAASEELCGKTALITGASRGLGAAITRALALRGCRVLANFQQSLPEAECLRDHLPEGRVELLQGDAADGAWWTTVRERYPAIDFLILNACPTVLPMRLEAETVDRVNAYVARSLALVSVPLAAFGDAVHERIVLVSSAYIESQPKEFPHYVAAKAAAEGLVHAVARHSRNASFLIVRPPKLMTDMTNTAYGASDAMAPELIASALVDRLCRPASAAPVETMSGAS